ncbi:hypothetical protein ABLN87_10490 [Ruegeria sp. SCPT10]|uniref:VOC family protein n=1 Tax=Ruegeria sp. SCP10 TaxID=3141377 RepID=UPI00333928D8
MKHILSMTLAMLCADGSAAQDTALLAMGAYVPSDDMQESETFYRTLFARDPMIQLEGFVAFDISGGWFAIVSRNKYAPDAQAGTGAIPYIRSGNLSMLRTRIQNTGAEAPEIIEDPGIHLLKITDPNGQLVEFFQLISQ